MKGENQSRSGNKQTNPKMGYIPNPTWATYKESAPTTTTIITVSCFPIRGWSLEGWSALTIGKKYCYLYVSVEVNTGKR